MNEDADPAKMIERKWALAEGRFKMLTKDEARDLEESEEFKVTDNAMLKLSFENTQRPSLGGSPERSTERVSALQRGRNNLRSFLLTFLQVIIFPETKWLLRRRTFLQFETLH